MKTSFTPFPELDTERLLLRQLKTDDVDTLYKLRTNDKVNQYIDRPSLENPVEAAEFIIKINGSIEQNETLYWAITLKDSPFLIGTVCLWKFSSEHNSAEVGYELGPNYHRQGIMSEVLTAVLKLGFGELELGMIEAFTHYENTSSIKLLEKHSFTRDQERFDSGNENNIIFTLSAS